jgi:hypothetical protein
MTNLTMVRLADFDALVCEEISSLLQAGVVPETVEDLALRNVLAEYRIVEPAPAPRNDVRAMLKRIRAKEREERRLAAFVWATTLVMIGGLIAMVWFWARC